MFPHLDEINSSITTSIQRITALFYDTSILQFSLVISEMDWVNWLFGRPQTPRSAPYSRDDLDLRSYALLRRGKELERRAFAEIMSNTDNTPEQRHRELEWTERKDRIRDIQNHIDPSFYRRRPPYAMGDGVSAYDQDIYATAEPQLPQVSTFRRPTAENFGYRGSRGTGRVSSAVNGAVGTSRAMPRSRMSSRPIGKSTRSVQTSHRDDDDARKVFQEALWQDPMLDKTSKDVLTDDSLAGYKFRKRA